MVRVRRTWIQASGLSLVGSAALALASAFLTHDDELALGATPVRVVSAPAASELRPKTGSLTEPLETQSEARSRAARSSAARSSAARSSAAEATSLERLEALLTRFEAMDERLAALERRPSSGASPPAGVLIPAPTTPGAPADSGDAQLAARLAALESRLDALGKPQRLEGFEKRLGRLQRRFKKAEAKVTVSQLNVEQQVGLALESPLGRELITRVEALEDKLESVLSKRMVEASSFGNLIPGLWGTYYADRYYTERAGVRVDAQLDFDWKSGGPEPLGAQADRFSIRWEGVLRITEPGTYSFYTVSDDGIRFWLGEQLVLAEYDDHAPQEDLVDVVLEPGDYPLRVEYYENGGHAVARLLWKRDGADRGPIPATCLFHTLDQERM